MPRRQSSSAVPHRSASPALCLCGHAASFRRRASSFVCGVWSRRRCYWRRRGAGGRGACGSQCGVHARAAVLWLRPMQRRRVRCDSRGARCAGVGQCERGGCMRTHAGCNEKGGGLPVLAVSTARAAARAACVRPPVSVREMLLTLPQAVVVVAAAESPSRLVRVHGLRRRRRPARGGGTRRGGGVGVALPIDDVVGRAEDAVGLAERSDGLVEAQAERGICGDRKSSCQ